MTSNVRIYMPISVPDDVNQELLQEDVAKLGDVGVSMMSDGWAFTVYDADVTDDAIQAVVDAHDASVKTVGQVRSEAVGILFSRVNKRLIKEMIKPKPDFGALYDEVADIIDNEAIVSALNNTIALQNDVYLTGIAPKSERAKKQALLAFIQVLSLWYEI